MEVPAEAAQLLREGLSNAEVSRRTGLHPVKVGDIRRALGLPAFHDVLPVYVAPDSHRPHGSRAKYNVERCRCRRCRNANRDGENQRIRLLAYGQYVPPYVDAGPVRAHLRYLQDCGMGLRAIAAAAGINRKTLQSILGGRPERGKGPRHAVTPRCAAALLAVEPSLDALGAHTVISGIGTARRLQALAAAGWPLTHIAAEIGWTVQNLRVLITAPTTMVKTARLVRDVYGRLWNVDPADHGASPGGITRAKQRAVQERWAPVGAWDDDTIDDPSARPDWTGHCGTARGIAVHEEHGIPLCPPCEAAAERRQLRNKARALSATRA